MCSTTEEVQAQQYIFKIKMGANVSPIGLVPLRKELYFSESFDTLYRMEPFNEHKAFFKCTEAPFVAMCLVAIMTPF